MSEKLTIAKIAKQFKRDRTTVLRWIEHDYFPNAKLVESPAGNYWEIPYGDLKDFVTPVRGPKKPKI